MESHISATDAVRRFSDLLNRIRYRGEAFIVERGGEPVCRIGAITPPRCTVADLVRVLDGLQGPDAGYLGTVEKVARRQPKLPKGPALAR